MSRAEMSCEETEWSFTGTIQDFAAQVKKCWPGNLGLLLRNLH